jgi:KaiC/GvpD/RAD55 family RecA-like ATPase
MTRSASIAPKISSGIDEIDQSWGGLFAGGIYLVFGRSSSGRNHAAHLFLRAGADAGRKIALGSPTRRRDLEIQAAAVGLDLGGAARAGQLDVFSLRGVADLESLDDDRLDAAIQNLADEVTRSGADRVALLDFTLPAQYESLQRMRAGFERFVRLLEGAESTVLITMPEPASEQARDVLDFVSTCMTGVVHTRLVRTDQDVVRRQLSLIPEIGHVTRRIDRLWNLDEVVALADRLAPPPAAAPTPVEIRGLPSETGPKVTQRVATTSHTEYDSEAPARPGQDHETQETGLDAEMPPEEDADAPEELIDTDPSASAAAAPALKSGTPGRLFDDREEFLAELQHHFGLHSSEDIPFLLLAMRIDGGKEQESESVEFEFMIDVVRNCLNPRDAVFSDLVNERLVVILEAADSDEAQKFFGRLRDTLRHEAPHHADRLLHAVSAIVVPNGKPFDSAQDFLRYVLDDAQTD